MGLSANPSAGLSLHWAIPPLGLSANPDSGWAYQSI